MRILSNVNICKGRRLDDLSWVRGYVWPGSSSFYIVPYNYGVGYDAKGNRVSAAAYEIIPETLGQYTGKDDENHNSIYVGDLVESNFSGVNQVYEVVFQDSSFGLKWLHNDEEHFAAFSSFVNSVSFRIVGNVHDNLSDSLLDKLLSCKSPELAVPLLEQIQKNFEKEKGRHKKNQKYVDAISIAIQAVQKQVPKEATLIETEDYAKWLCPTCEEFIASDEDPVSERCQRCDSCGQVVTYGRVVL